MIDFTIHHKKEPLNKVVAVELPMNADNLSDLLQELGYEPPEKLKVNSKGKPYVIELNSDTNMGFAILERLCDNDTIAELNNLCAVICKCSDQEYIYQTIFNSDVRCINGIKKLLADRFMEFSDKLVLNTSLERKPTELVKKVGNFTMISSKLLRNKEIPNKLLGFLLKVLSLPDYWHFSMSGLKAICKEGKTAVHIGLPDCSMPEFILFSAWLKFDIKISLADNVIQRNSMNHVIPKRCLFAWFIVSIRIIRISVDIKLASVNSNKFVLSFINS